MHPPAIVALDRFARGDEGYQKAVAAWYSVILVMGSYRIYCSLQSGAVFQTLRINPQGSETSR